MQEAVNPSGRKVLASGPVRRQKNTREREEEEDKEEEEKEEKEEKQRPKVLPPTAAARQLAKILYFSLAIVLCIFATNMATFYHHERIASWFVAPDTDATWPLQFSSALPIEPVAYNTTTPAILFETRLNLAKHLLATRGVHPCLCMHHMRVPSNVTRVRACGVLNDQQFYFMRNLRLIGYNKGAPVHDVLETCNGGAPAIRKRASQLYVEWDDDASILHYAQFRDGTAFCLQRIMDEFEGKC